MTKTDIVNAGLGLESSDRIEKGGTLFVRAFVTTHSECLISVMQFDSDPDLAYWIVRLDVTLYSSVKPKGKELIPFVYRIKTIEDLERLIRVYTEYEVPK